MAPHILYFVHDQSDNSIARRIRMLVAGGAKVTVAGFRRSNAPFLKIEGCDVIDLGKTVDGHLVARAVSVGKASRRLNQLEESLQTCEAILARNLEMLVLANRARALYAPKTIRLVYECLDIHRLLFSNNFAGRLLRAIEARAWKHVDLLVTSSPRFISSYFQPRKFSRPIRLVENKVFFPEHMADTLLRISTRLGGPPWRIGWFGMIRCRKSFSILKEITRSAGGAVEVVIRGRPSLREFPDFEGLLRSSRHMSFDGPYSYSDLASIYGDVHFSWAIDFFEEGLNSAWLLPNRIYESTLFGAVPVAVDGTETAKWGRRHGVETIFHDPLINDLTQFFRQLNVSQYAHLKSIVDGIPRHDLIDTVESCRDLVMDICNGPQAAIRKPFPK
jgi:succinoglycan biosynthesis protein ExoL